MVYDIAVPLNLMDLAQLQVPRWVISVDGHASPRTAALSQATFLFGLAGGARPPSCGLFFKVSARTLLRGIRGSPTGWPENQKDGSVTEVSGKVLVEWGFFRADEATATEKLDVNGQSVLMTDPIQ